MTKRSKIAFNAITICIIEMWWHFMLSNSVSCLHDINHPSEKYQLNFRIILLNYEIIWLFSVTKRSMASTMTTGIVELKCKTRSFSHFSLVRIRKCAVPISLKVSCRNVCSLQPSQNRCKVFISVCATLQFTAEWLKSLWYHVHYP